MKRREKKLSRLFKPMVKQCIETCEQMFIILVPRLTHNLANTTKLITLYNSTVCGLVLCYIKKLN